MAKALCLVGIVYLIFCAGRFFYSQQNTTPADVLNGKYKDTLTVIYRSTCPRCQKTLPWFFIREGLSTQKINVISADEFTKDQLKEMGVEVLPTFIYEGKAYNTIDRAEIVQLVNTAKDAAKNTITQLQK